MGKIFVRLTWNSNLVKELDYVKDESRLATITLKKLREDICRQFEISNDELRVFFAGSELTEQEQLLNEIGIVNETYVDAMKCPKGADWCVKVECDGIKIDIFVRPQGLLGDLKEAISKKTNVPEIIQILKMGDKELGFDDNEYLEKLGVNGATVIKVEVDSL